MNTKCKVGRYVHHYLIQDKSDVKRIYTLFKYTIDSKMNTENLKYVYFCWYMSISLDSCPQYDHLFDFDVSRHWMNMFLSDSIHPVSEKPLTSKKTAGMDMRTFNRLHLVLFIAQNTMKLGQLFPLFLIQRWPFYQLIRVLMKY